VAGNAEGRETEKGVSEEGPSRGPLDEVYWALERYK